jgi:hypothetical protein
LFFSYYFLFVTTQVDTETGAATVIAVTGTVEVTSQGKTVLVQQGEASFEARSAID